MSTAQSRVRPPTLRLPRCLKHQKNRSKPWPYTISQYNSRKIYQPFCKIILKLLPSLKGRVGRTPNAASSEPEALHGHPLFFSGGGLHLAGSRNPRKWRGPGKKCMLSPFVASGPRPGLKGLSFGASAVPVAEVFWIGDLPASNSCVLHWIAESSHLRGFSFFAGHEDEGT